MFWWGEKPDNSLGAPNCFFYIGTTQKGPHDRPVPLLLSQWERGIVRGRNIVQINTAISVVGWVTVPTEPTILQHVLCQPTPLFLAPVWQGAGQVWNFSFCRILLPEK